MSDLAANPEYKSLDLRSSGAEDPLTHVRPIAVYSGSGRERAAT